MNGTRLVLLGWLILMGGLTLVGAQPPREGDVRRGKIKKIDPARKVVTLTLAGKDQVFSLTEDTRVLDVTGKTLAERLKGFTEGTEVFFKTARRDGKEVIVGLKRVTGGPVRPPLAGDTSKLRPLTELGKDLYQGKPGGLYPDGKNERPPAHEAAGRRLAAEVLPRDAEGKRAAGGKIGLLSVGMSNTSQVSTGFQQLLRAEKGLNPRLVFVNGAQGGMTAAAIQDPTSRTGERYWKTVDQRLESAGLTRAQVQVAWIKQADAGPTEGFPGYAQKLQKELMRIVGVLHVRFPNLKLVYLSSRTYGGYATTRLNPEPYAYESAFAVKWLIEQQIAGEADLAFDPKKGAVKAPWLSWGPYLWANGRTKRLDGHFFEPGDFTPNDGTHLTPACQRKTGGLLLRFFKTDSTAKTWFLDPRGTPPAGG